MLKMSFYNGTLNEKQLIQFIKDTDKPIVYTYGFEYRGPSTHRVPMSKEDAIKTVNHRGFLDATEEENCLHLNEFSDNDMW